MYGTSVVHSLLAPLDTLCVCPWGHISLDMSINVKHRYATKKDYKQMPFVPNRDHNSHTKFMGGTANIVVGNWGGGQFERTMRSDRRAFLPKQ